MRENTGGVVSATVTVLVISVAAFPELSETLYRIIYEPSVSVSTLPVTIIAEDIFPS
jgi:hypothetical protein